MFSWLKKRFLKPSASNRDRLESEAAPASAAQAGGRDNSAVHKTAGDECLQAGALHEAVAHYRKALSVDPSYAQVHALLGDALRGQGKLGEAARCYRTALEFAPALADAHYGLGVTRLESLDFQNALVHFRNALSRVPDLAKAHTGIGCALLQLGKRAEALACFQRAIEIEPANGMALHLAASLSGSNPDHAPRQYVEKLFDGFADTFDAQLQQLHYDTPKKLLALIDPLRPADAGGWNILDLGCGTGLTGLEVAAYANQLVGVDLSARMLEKARARNLYHRLEHKEMVAMMAEEPAASYDLVISTDAFIYIGKLDDVVRAAKRLLRPGGLLAFSVEALETLAYAPSDQSPAQDYLLQTAPSCRYAHASPYLLRLASDNAFRVCQMTTTQLRKSEGKSIRGHLVVMEKLHAD